MDLRRGVRRGFGMSDTPEFDDLIKRLRALLASEYRRGQADAARRIIEVAQGEVSPLASSSAQTGTIEVTAVAAAKPNGHAMRQRAPAGAPDALVKRVLMARGSEGASSRLIEDLAESEEEKMVSQSGIRFALDRGKTAGRYRNENGKWFLVEETKN